MCLKHFNFLSEIFLPKVLVDFFLSTFFSFHFATSNSKFVKTKGWAQVIVELPGLGLRVDGEGGLQGDPPGLWSSCSFGWYSNPPFKSKNHIKKPGTLSAVVYLRCSGPACLKVAQNGILSLQWACQGVYCLPRGLELQIQTEGAWFADEIDKKRDRKPLEIPPRKFSI